MSYQLDEDDYYADGSPGDWHYGSGEPSSRHPLKYNWVTHVWECGCPAYVYKGSCQHAIRLRKEEIVEVNERYL